ncbi:hypothetical protein FBR05_14960 [Deltaproteobacteria bacterium PRO3]|nr:hypothetical protein [Deltaproteobacteria bacterium PRO3]
MEETLKSAAPSATQLYNLGTALAHAGEYARAHGMPAQRLRSFPDTEGAIAALSDVAPEVRWILVKGSRGMHLEKIVSYLKERY